MWPPGARAQPESQAAPARASSSRRREARWRIGGACRVRGEHMGREDTLPPQGDKSASLRPAGARRPPGSALMIIFTAQAAEFIDEDRRTERFEWRMLARDRKSVV